MLRSIPDSMLTEALSLVNRPKADKQADGKKEKEVNWILIGIKIAWHLFGLRAEVKKNGLAFTKMAEKTLGKWSTALGQLQKIIKEDIGPEIEIMDDHDSDDGNSSKSSKGAPSLNTAWKQFSTQVDGFADSVKKLSNGIVELSEADIAQYICTMLGQLPVLFESFNDLGLDTKIRNLSPDSLDSVKESTNNFIAKHIEGFIPKDLQQRLQALYSKTDSLNTEAFAKLPEYQQDSMLVIAGEINHILKELFLMMDKLGIQLSIDEGYLSKRPFKLLGDKSVYQHAIHFTRIYESYMKAAGYSSTENLPFTDAVRLQRLEMKQQLKEELKKEEKKFEEEQKTFAQESKQAIQVRLNQLSDSPEKSLLQSLHIEMDRKIKCISRLTADVGSKTPVDAKRIRKAIGAVDTAIKSVSSEIMNASPKVSAETIEVVKSIEATAERITRTRDQRTAHIFGQQERIDARLKRAEIRMHTTPEQRVDEYRKKLRKLIKDQERELLNDVAKIATDSVGLISTTISGLDKKYIVRDFCSQLLECKTPQQALKALEKKHDVATLQTGSTGELIKKVESNYATAEGVKAQKIAKFEIRRKKLRFRIKGELQDCKDPVPDDIDEPSVKQPVNMEDKYGSSKSSSKSSLSKSKHGSDVAADKKDSLKYFQDQKWIIPYEGKTEKTEPKPLESPADVFKYVADTTIETLKQEAERLKKQLFADSKEVKSDTLNTTTLEAMLESLDTQFKTILDERIYEDYFVRPQQRSGSKASSWVESLGNSFATLRHTVLSLKAAMQKRNAGAPRAATPAENLKKFVDVVTGSVTNLSNTISAFDNLMKNDFVRRLTSPVTAQEYVKSVFDPLLKHTNSIKIVNVDVKGGVIEGVANRVDAFHRSYYQNQGQEAKLAFSNTVAEFLKLYNGKLLAFSDPLTKNGKSDYLIYAIQNKIWRLFVNLPLAISSMSLRSMQFGLEFVQRVNLFIKDLYLVMDKIEMDFYLKEGFISQFKIFGDPSKPNECRSISDFVKDFHAMVSTAGYEFNPEDRFPYTQAIAHQRHKAALAVGCGNERHQWLAARNNGGHNFIDMRAEQAEDQWESESNTQIKSNNLMHHMDNSGNNYHYRHAINQRIAEIKKTGGRSLSPDQHKTIQLLEFLRNSNNSSTFNARLTMLTNRSLLYSAELYYVILHNDDYDPESKRKQDRKHVSKADYAEKMQTALKKIELYNLAKNDMHLLYQGRTGEMIRSLQKVGATRNDVLNKIDLRILELKQSREESYYYRSGTTRANIEIAILAWTRFKTLMKKPGYAFTDAFSELSALYPASYNYLFDNENAYWREVRDLDGYVSAAQRGKKHFNPLKDDVKAAAKQSSDVSVSNTEHRVMLFDAKFAEAQKNKDYKSLLLKQKTEHFQKNQEEHPKAIPVVKSSKYDADISHTSDAAPVVLTVVRPSKYDLSSAPRNEDLPPVVVRNAQDLRVDFKHVCAAGTPVMPLLPFVGQAETTSAVTLKVSTNQAQPAQNHPEISQPVKNVADHKNPSFDYLTISINKRITELKNSFYRSWSVRNKILLLEDLVKELKKPATTSLNSAVEALRDRTENRDNFYLLFEGRTGKVMKTLEYSQLSKRDIAHRIQLEITRLQKQRTEHLWFFAQSRKKTLEERIQALFALKAVISGLNKHNFDSSDALNQLTRKHRAVLNANEPRLLEDLRLWQTSHYAQNDLEIGLNDNVRVNQRFMEDSRVWRFI